MKWEIRHNEDGTYSIYQNNRIFEYEDELEMAERTLRNHKATSYVLVSQDNYRETKRL